MELMNQFLAPDAELFIARFELRVHRAPDSEQWRTVMRDLNAEVFSYDEGVERRVGEDLAPSEEVHSEQLCGLVLLVELADVRLQVNVVRSSRKNPKGLQFRREREGFRDFLVDLRLGERLDGPDRLLLALQSGPSPAWTADDVHAFL